MAIVPPIALCPFGYGQNPKSRPADVVAARSPRELIGIASEKTTSAETNRDFGEIIYYLDKALASKTIVPEHRKYARQLKGWAHNRLGENFSQQGKNHQKISRKLPFAFVNFMKFSSGFALGKIASIEIHTFGEKIQNYRMVL